MITVNKTYLIAGILLLISLIVTSLGIYGFFKYQFSNRIACTSIPSKAVLGQTTRPALPDLVKNEGRELDPKKTDDSKKIQSLLFELDPKQSRILEKDLQQ